MMTSTAIAWPQEPQVGETPILLFVPAWNYNDRYLAQPIVPHVLLGPYHLVRRTEYLKEHNVKHILCIRDPAETFFLRETTTEPPLQFHFIDVPSDVTKLSVIPYFSQANQMLKTMVEKGDNVLVCCGDGIDKSTSFVAAYLMSTYALKAVDAVTFVQNQRYCATPSPAGYRIKLLEYEPICAAQRNGGSGESNGTARRRDDSDDEEDVMQSDQRPMAADASGNSPTDATDGHLRKRAR
ncbi:hypothetical protein FB645_000024 [Coemansia sp. IMI 203386]|nr:hypothetical protein FB645_000024 [Coemansia sp. IMI 203386]